MTKEKIKLSETYGTAEQFTKVILRWMPEWASDTAEGRLIAAMFGQAWADGSSWFFRRDCPALKFYCDRLELGIDAICEAYEKCNPRHAKALGLI
jgi:hypothetical protein